MRIQIAIPITQSKNPADYLGSTIDASGNVELPNDVGLSIRIAPKPTRRAFPGPEAIVLIAEFTSGVAAGVLSNWIYERLHGRTPKVLIDNQSVATDNKTEIENAISVPKPKTRRQPRRNAQKKRR